MNANTDYRDLLVDILGHGVRVQQQKSAGSSGRDSFEIINGSFKVPMQYPILTIKKRALNYAFMANEAAWILSGDNRLQNIQRTMRRYADYSDDGVFLRGAYGPKVVDQLPFVVHALTRDINSRQAVLSIWRERPDLVSRDIPCTLTMQFLVRDKTLHTIVMMRSWDAYWGLPYDIFSFSAISASVAALVPDVEELGTLHVTAGSLHIYENHRGAIEELVRMPPELILDPLDYAPAFNIITMRYQSELLLQQLQLVANKVKYVSDMKLEVSHLFYKLMHHEA